ncbi:MAG: protocatechuate 3,4-dioxygenase subunit alpha, partial [Deinococcales bacterium]
MMMRHLQSPSQTVGPFFHYGLILGGENNLVKAKSQGQRIILKGQVLDGDGLAVPDAMLEIWQPDSQGIFNHPQDPRHAQADPHFNGFGRSDTRHDGGYLFHTIKPGAISPELAPYINVRLFSRGLLIHAISRFYFADETSNAHDPLLNSLDATRRNTLIMQKIANPQA